MIPRVTYEVHSDREPNAKNHKPVIAFLTGQRNVAKKFENINAKASKYCNVIDRFLSILVVVIAGAGSITTPFIEKTTTLPYSSIFLSTVALITTLSSTLEYGKKAPQFSQIEHEYTKIINLIDISIVYLETAEQNNEDVDFNITGMIEEIQHVMETIQHMSIDPPFFISAS
jgi:hypothetical protein